MILIPRCGNPLRERLISAPIQLPVCQGASEQAQSACPYRRRTRQDTPKRSFELPSTGRMVAPEPSVQCSTSTPQPYDFSTVSSLYCIPPTSDARLASRTLWRCWTRSALARQRRRSAPAPVRHRRRRDPPTQVLWAIARARLHSAVIMLPPAKLSSLIRSRVELA